MSDLDKFKLDLEHSIYGSTPEGHCVDCKQPFSDANVRTPAGWAETRISKLCENCFDNLFSEDDESEDGKHD